MCPLKKDIKKDTGKSKGVPESLAYDSFYEQERKYNVRHPNHVGLLQQSIIADDHFVTLDYPPFRSDLMASVGLIGAPQEITAPRQRFYFDDLRLSGFLNGVEIRIEPRRQGREEGWPFRQVVKIGEPGSAEQHTLQRMEYPARLRALKPDLTVVGNGNGRYLADVFNVKSLARAVLHPLLRIHSQRWKMEYHPEGDPDTLIELALDVGRGQTLSGYVWDIRQLELEIKAGDPQTLDAEERYLRTRFPFLEPEFRSKPTPGFEILGSFIDVQGPKPLKKLAQAGAFPPPRA